MSWLTKLAGGVIVGGIAVTYAYAVTEHRKQCDLWLAHQITILADLQRHTLDRLIELERMLEPGRDVGDAPEIDGNDAFDSGMSEEEFLAVATGDPGSETREALRLHAEHWDMESAVVLTTEELEGVDAMLAAMRAEGRLVDFPTRDASEPDLPPVA